MKHFIAFLFLVAVAMASSSVATHAVAAPGANATDKVGPSSSGPAALNELLAQFRGVSGLSAQYREEKHMDLLVRPLLAQGTLHYARPGRLARLQTEPGPARAVIVGDDLWFHDGTSRERVDLAKRPAVRMFVDSILLVLAGDGDALAKLYRVKFQEEAGAWSLELRPVVAPIDKVIDTIELRGRGVELESMVVREKAGDVTKTEFDSVNAARRYTETELQQIFRVPSP